MFLHYAGRNGQISVRGGLRWSLPRPGARRFIFPRILSDKHFHILLSDILIYRRGMHFFSWRICFRSRAVCSNASIAFPSFFLDVAIVTLNLSVSAVTVTLIYQCPHHIILHTHIYVFFTPRVFINRQQFSIVIQFSVLSGALSWRVSRQLAGKFESNRREVGWLDWRSSVLLNVPEIIGLNANNLVAFYDLMSNVWRESVLSVE
jgi:hypothetical protein